MRDEFLLRAALNDLVFENIPIGILHFDFKGTIIACNTVLESMIGTTKDHLIGVQLQQLPDKKISYLVNRALAGELTKATGEYQSVITGKIFPYSATFVPVIEGENVLGGVGIIEDATESKRIDQLIHHATYHDRLTNLPNRFLFKEQLSIVFSQAQKAQTKLAILFIDIDRFKKVNDTLGHDVGDKLLKALSDRLTTCLDNEKHFLSRFGGDEFVLFLPDIAYSDEIAQVANQILNIFRESLFIDKHELHLSASIGISIYPADGEDIETIVKHADVATYRAKEMGRNNYQFYTPAMNEKAYDRLALESNLRKALDQNQFLLYFQPQVDLATCQIIGMEALIRWNHPERGMVSPAEFIPLSEETGLIIPIGEWVLRTACVQNKAFQEAGYSPIRVAVNLSVTQFQQPNIVETVARILEETGLDPYYLELELTETVIILNVDSTIKKIKELKEMGVHIAIDDFGTGYSSLSYLSSLSIDTLKIDRSFVKHIISKSNDALISSAIINLAHNLNLSVIAEGVETAEQREFLRSKDCNMMQGYLFSKPVSVEDIKAILIEWNVSKKEGLN
jgi:diguanylate cyclase (GGDEF)-like protein/PAS domain S-box-containing protein